VGVGRAVEVRFDPGDRGGFPAPPGRRGNGGLHQATVRSVSTTATSLSDRGGPWARPNGGRLRAGSRAAPARLSPPAGPTPSMRGTLFIVAAPSGAGKS